MDRWRQRTWWLPAALWPASAEGGAGVAPGAPPARGGAAGRNAGGGPPHVGAWGPRPSLGRTSKTVYRYLLPRLLLTTTRRAKKHETNGGTKKKKKEGNTQEDRFSWPQRMDQW